MTRVKQMSSLAIALAIAVALGVLVFAPAFAGSVEPPHSHAVTFARPPHQDPTPPPPPPPPDDGGNIFQNITQLINFPFASLVEALQTAMQEILRAALGPLQNLFESVLSLWLQNPGILSDGNAALPGWDLMRDAWQFMYSIGVAFWPLTLAVIAAIAAKDAVAASTWGLGDLKQALGTWLVAVILSATSLWWMDLANQLANAITSYILHNFAGPQFYPGSFMAFFSAVLPGLFLAFPLVGIIIIMFLLLLAITIFVGLTFAIIARLVLMYLLVALGPIGIILGVLPPLRFVTQMWTRGFLLVLALGPVNALLLKMAFNVAQYASSAPVVQGAAAFVGVFGLLSILITINFAVVKGVFGAVIAVAQQTMAAVKTVGQMVVAGALLMSGAGAGVAAGGAASGAAGGASGEIGGGGSGGVGGAALSGAGAEGQSANGAKSGTPITAPNAVGGNGSGRSPWRPSGRGMAAAGSYLQTTRSPLAGFGALLRAAGVEQLNHERAGIFDKSNDATDPEQALGFATDTGARGDTGGASGQLERGHEFGGRVTDSGAIGYAGAEDAGNGGVDGARKSSALSAGASTQKSASPDLSTRDVSKQVAEASQTTGGALGVGTAVGANPALGKEIGAGAPPRRANLDSIPQSRAAMGFGDVAPRDGVVSASAIASVGAQESLNQVERSGQVPDSSSMGSESSAVQESGIITSVPSDGDLDDSVSKDRAGMGFGESLTTRDEEELAAHDVRGTSDSQVEPVTFQPARTDSDHSAYAMPMLAPAAERTLSMLPVESDDARFQAAQLVSQYEPAEQGNVAAALEHAMRATNEQHGVGWSSMGEVMERGLWSTQEAANNGIPLQEMARQMEPFSGTRDPGDYLAWQLTGGSEQFHLPSQQVPYLPAPGPYDFQAGRYIEQQTGGVVSYQEAAQMFHVIRDPSTPGGGWNKGRQFIGEVNRVARLRGGDAMLELDRWIQTNAPTRARLLWNIHFKVAKTES